MLVRTPENLVDRRNNGITERMPEIQAIFDALFFSLLGFGAHLFEDALVFKVGYPYLWPFSSQKLGIGLIPTIVSEETYIRDFLGIANTDVLIIGVVFFLLAILIRTWYEGFSWIRWYMPDKIYEKFFRKTES